MTSHTKTLQGDLYEEMKARIKEDDSSVPYFYNGYFYITRFETGQDYPIFARKKEVYLQMKKFCLTVMKWQKDMLILN